MAECKRENSQALFSNQNNSIDDVVVYLNKKGLDFRIQERENVTDIIKQVTPPEEGTLIITCEEIILPRRLKK